MLKNSLLGQNIFVTSTNTFLLYVASGDWCCWISPSSEMMIFC